MVDSDGGTLAVCKRDICLTGGHEESTHTTEQNHDPTNADICLD
jgi:hypothetical protein